MTHPSAESHSSAKALLFIHDYINENGYPPTRREIAEAGDYQSANGGQKTIDRLVRQGLVTVVPLTPRSVRITAAGMKALTETM